MTISEKPGCCHYTGKGVTEGCDETAGKDFVALNDQGLKMSLLGFLILLTEAVEAEGLLDAENILVLDF